MSTACARFRISLPSACATQPATAILHVAAFGLAALLQNAQPADLRIDLLGGLFPDVAGIQEEEIGVFGALGRRVSSRRQDSAIRSES